MLQTDGVRSEKTSDLIRNPVLQSLYKQRTMHIIALLFVAWSIVFCYIPMSGLYMAISDYKVTKPIFAAEFAGLKYFQQFLTDANVWAALKNTLGISILNIIFGFPIPILFALLLNEIANTHFKRIVQTVSYLPHFVSWVILGGFLLNWTSSTGLINDILMRLNLTNEPIYLLAEAKYFWGTAVISGIWKEMGWGAIIYIAAIAGINPELYEAATIDGAGRFRKITSITLPCILSTVSIMFIFTIGNLLNSNFDQIFVLKNTLNASSSTVLDIYVYRQGISLARYSYATAVGLLKSVVSFGLLLLTNKVSNRLTGSSFL